MYSNELTIKWFVITYMKNIKQYNCTQQVNMR